MATRFAPTGRDAELITTVLQQNGVLAQVADSATLPSAHPGDEPMGPLLIAEEALSTAVIRRLSGLILRQPAWSDLPILILTAGGRETSHRLQGEWRPLGSPVLLERPIRTATLVSSVEAALRARVRQYEVRDAVAELKQQQETLQVVLDNLPVGVLLAKPTGEVVLANRRLLTMEPSFAGAAPGAAPSAAPGATFSDWPNFFPDGSRVSPAQHPLARAMQTKQPVGPEEFLYANQEGTRTWISMAGSPILNEKNALVGGVLTVADVNQQKRSEAALIQNEKLAAVGRLAASISHEINNPLEAVTNLLYLARGSEGLPTEVHEYLTSAEQELARVSQIVSHTLRFHKQATNARAITAGELLGPTLGLYSGRLANSDISLEVQDRSVSLITCYEGEIRQILNNLVGNAIDSMKAGGRLIIRTRDSRAWSTGTEGVRIIVADSGHGMSEDVKRRVFEPFYTTKGIGGTGLGLWISKGIIDKHGGVLQLYSSFREGKSGTAFSLFLPRDLMPAHAAVASAGA